MKKIKFDKKREIVAGLGLVGVAFLVYGGVSVYNNRPIKNADSTMKMTKNEVKTFDSVYGTKSGLKEAVQKTWSGRNSDSIVTVNKNKLTNSEEKLINNMNDVADYVTAPNYYNKQYSASQALLISGKTNSTNHYNKADNTKDSLNSVVKEVQSLNSGKLSILKGHYVIPVNYLSASEYNNKYNVTMMTQQASASYDKYVAASENYMSGDTKAMFIRSVPVYRNQTDKVPIGFQLQTRGIKKLAGSYVNKKSQLKQSDAKLSDKNKQYNVYIRNAQEGYKIDYSTGKVSYR